jgi:hypothetical protein
MNGVIACVCPFLSWFLGHWWGLCLHAWRTDIGQSLIHELPSDPWDMAPSPFQKGYVSAYSFPEWRQSLWNRRSSIQDYEKLHKLNLISHKLEPAVDHRAWKNSKLEHHVAGEPFFFYTNKIFKISSLKDHESKMMKKNKTGGHILWMNKHICSVSFPSFDRCKTDAAFKWHVR